MKNKFKLATFNLWKDEGNFPKRITKIAEYLKNLIVSVFKRIFIVKEFAVVILSIKI